ncbi:AAA family ATPase [Leptolyngbya sp. PL-A3]
MIGLPGSGKSTLAAQFALEGWTWVSTDRIRAQLYGDEAIQGNWAQVWGEVQRELRAIAQLPHGKALYDATNVVRRPRRQLIALARSWGFRRVTACWLDVPLEVCLERNQRRSRQVPVDVICRMHRRLEGGRPSLEEGLDALITVDFMPTQCTDSLTSSD